MYFIGIDLAWSVRNTSGAAAIYAQGNRGRLSRHHEHLGDDNEIISFVTRAAGAYPALVAIDAPLLVPNQTNTRPCDRELTRVFRSYHAGTYPANRKLLTRFDGRVRGEEIVRQLTALNFSHSPYLPRQAEVRQIVEVYPNPATIRLFALPKILKYKARRGRTLEYRQGQLSELQKHIDSLAQATPALEVDKSLFPNPASLSGNAFKAHEDLLDAILCAYIIYHAWYWGPEGYEIFGDLKNGYILVPRLPAHPQPPQNLRGSDHS